MAACTVMTVQAHQRGHLAALACVKAIVFMRVHALVAQVAVLAIRCVIVCVFRCFSACALVSVTGLRAEAGVGHNGVC